MPKLGLNPVDLVDLLYASDIGIVTVDANMTITGWFGAADEMYGWEDDEILGQPVSVLSPDGQMPSDWTYINEVSKGGTVDFTRLRRRKDGSTFLAEIRARPICQGGRAVGAVSIVRDVTKLVALEERVGQAERRFESAFHGAALPMVMCELSGEIVESNTAYELLTKTAPSDATTRVLDIIEPSGRPAVAAALATLATDPGRFEGIEVPAVGRPNHILNVSISPVDNGPDLPLLALVQLLDVSDQLRIQAELAEIATIDLLTGTFTRSCLEPLLESLAPMLRFGLLFIDLDNFKEINDTAGHAAGDAILEAVGPRLDAVVRDSDYVIRYGGDEFIIVCPGLEDIGAAGRLGDRLRASVAAPVLWDDQQLTVTASVGAVTCIAGPDLDAQLVIAQADAAMYAAKASGRDATVTES